MKKTPTKTNSFHYATRSAHEVMAAFAVTHGLSDKEAAQRLAHYGRNILTQHHVHWWEVLVRQFKSPFVYLLGGAALLSLLLGEVADGVIIIVLLLANTLLGFFQEYRSEKSLQLLSRFIAARAKVFRAGKEQIVNRDQLVPGDVVLLATGDQIPADVRFVEAHDVSIDESILTGEAVPVRKVTEPLTHEPKSYHDALNLGFAGTTVLHGSARAVVLNTGSSTAIGRIATLTAKTRHESNFEKGINRFSAFVFRLVIITLSIIVVVHLFVRGVHDLGSIVLFAIALAVGVIPEALPVVTTFSLSHGALQLARKKVVVKRLSAIEDLGGIEILCTDKTGTLTENKLTVAELSPYADAQTLYYAALASSDPQHVLEPFDVAVWEAMPTHLHQQVHSTHRIAEIPFDPHRRRNTVFVHEAHTYTLIVRGAPEVILECSSNVSAAEVARLHEWIAQRGEEGQRVLAVAKKHITGANHHRVAQTLHTQEKSLHFLGVIAFVDPIKSSTFDAVSMAKHLGVQVKILTGDNKEVAGSVAKRIALTKSIHDVITGEELSQLHGDALHHAIEGNTVFARISPEQKYRIIQHLQEKSAVGFLGEGINDAPALKVAGVSLVVNSASDITRDAADIILLKRDLKVIIDGVREGRAVFANTVKYIRATLSSNFGNFYSVALVSLFINFLPLLPLQILLINLLTDFPMIAISRDAVDPHELTSPRKYNVREITLVATILGLVSTTFDFLFFGLFVSRGESVLQTNWFIGSVLTELVLLYSIRTMRVFWKGRRPSFVLTIFTILAVAIGVVLPFTYLGSHIFHFVVPSVRDMVTILGLVVAYFVATEVVKNLYTRFVAKENL